MYQRKTLQRQMSRRLKRFDFLVASLVRVVGGNKNRGGSRSDEAVIGIGRG